MTAECIHLLNPAWCGDCNGVAAQQKKEDAAELDRVLALPGWWPAKYASACCECRTRYDFGTPITRCLEHPEPVRYRAMCCAPAGDPS